MRLLYTLGVRLYSFAIHLASLWNPKAKEWVEGRKNWEKNLPDLSNVDAHVFWFHCASLGEFEQGLPVMEKIKKEPNTKVLVSFFSPSGYRIKKNHPIADYTFYLPLDTKKNSEKLIAQLNPSAIVFVKYEFWANLILTAKEKKIKLYLISTVFRKSQIFFKSHGQFMRRVLSSFDKIFVQNKASAALLKTINISSEIAGDTRYDRVLSNTVKVNTYEEIENWINSRKVIVCGSVWKDDLDVISETIQKLPEGWCAIIAPHNIKSSDIKQARNFFPNSVLHSKLEPHIQSKVLLIDNIGMLQHIYSYGSIAYVGGGFGTGLHNILEPAAFNIPVVFGPQHEKFPEAKEFIDAGIGFSIADKEAFEDKFNRLQHESLTEKVKAFVRSNSGAVDKISSGIIE